MHADILIIGSGLAGYTLAKEIRRLSQDISIYILTQDDGAFYSKPLLSNSFSKHKSAESLAIKSAEMMAEELDATVLPKETVLSIDRQRKSISTSSQTITYQSLVLALGASPRQLSLPEAISDMTYSVNDLEDFAAFQKQLEDCKAPLVIGSGLVGCEFTNDLIKTGYALNVVSMDNYPLQQLVPEKVGHRLQSQLESEGAHFHFNTKITSARKENQQTIVSLESGIELPCDLVLSAAGLLPRTEIAKKADLSVNHGIVVDTLLQTSEPDIYAFGDCAEINGYVMMYIEPIFLSAKALAKTLTGTPTHVSFPAMPVLIKTPSLPLVCHPPLPSCEGKWQFEEQGNDIRAMFYDTGKQLKGFALTGSFVRERMKLAKSLPGVFATPENSAGNGN